MIGVSNEWEDKKARIIYKLRHYRSMVADYEACKELYNQLFPSCTQIITDMPKSPTESFQIEIWADKRLSQWARMERSLAEMQNEYEQIEVMINTLTGEYHTVLVRRYLLNESWETIAEKLHCARATACRWHDKAIWKLVKLETL